MISILEVLPCLQWDLTVSGRMPGETERDEPVTVVDTLQLGGRARHATHPQPTRKTCLHVGSEMYNVHVCRAVLVRRCMLQGLRSRHEGAQAHTPSSLPDLHKTAFSSPTPVSPASTGGTNFVSLVTPRPPSSCPPPCLLYIS